jgi:hypothetical protein
MYNYASLAAEQHALTYYQKIFPSFNLNGTTSKDAAQVLLAFKSLDARNQLLKRDLTFSTEDDALLFCWAEISIHHYIKREVWAGGKVKYIMALSNIIIDANIVQLGALTLNRMLLDGYMFKEKIGEHFLVTTPTGGIRATSARQCTCNTKGCHHLLAVNEILQNRKGTKKLYMVSH